MSSEINRKIAVIFVVDVVGYSKHMEVDENETVNSYNECESILDKLLVKYNGSVLLTFIFKTTEPLNTFPKATCLNSFSKEERYSGR